MTEVENKDGEHQRLRREYNQAVVSDRWLDLDNWVNEVGKGSHHEFEPEVRLLLTHHEPELRGNAVTTLASRWRLPSFRAECERLWRDLNEHEEVRQSALEGWGAYHHGTGNMSLAEEFYRIVGDSTEPVSVRQAALFRIGYVLDGRPNVFAAGRPFAGQAARTAEQFEEIVPWDKVKTFIDSYR